VTLVECCIGNCDIDFFDFHHCYHIMRLKFLKFKRGQNAAEKIQIDNNRSEKLQNSTILDEINF
jgi:hypothetical protein